MTKSINKQLIVPYSTQQMFDLINAVEQYAEFLPWCKSTEIHWRNDNALEATIHLSKGPISYSITTKNTMQPHNRIDMLYVAGPFKACHGTWRFEPTDKTSQCKIIFEMAYEFVSKMQGLLIEPVFNPIANTLIDAFYERAQKIYGK